MKARRIISAVALMLVTACLLTGCGVTVPRPKVKEAKFDFSVTYEMNGEMDTIRGALVCQYAGTSWTIDGGTFTRDWVGHVEGVEAGSGYKVQLSTTEDGGKIFLALGLSPAYFMGETYMLDFYTPEPGLFIEYSNEADDMATVTSDEEMIAEVYGIRIISYEYDEPIENSFSVFNF